MDTDSTLNRLNNTISHLNFVSNHNGTTVTELFLVIIVPHSVFLLQVVWTLCSLPVISHVILRFLIEFTCIIVPQLLLTTILANYSSCIGLLITLICSTVSVVCLLKIKRQSRVATQKVEDGLNIATDTLTVSRASIFSVSAICILAVDFPVFPRRFAKTETYGYGLMDLGVGLFVVANAAVSRTARQIKYLSKFDNFHHVLKTSVPLLILGLIRVVTIKVIGYHEHASEYGIHWNFFFTLAFVEIIAALLFIIIDALHGLWIGLILICTYQYLLSGIQFNQYLLKDPTLQSPYDGVWYYLDVNRCGICSCLGYLSIYLIGVTLGRLLFKKERKTIHDWIIIAVKLYTITTVLTITMSFSDTFIEMVSRRLANLTYVIWVISYSCYFLGNIVILNLSVAVLKQSGDGPNTSCAYIPGSMLLHVINRKGLVYFLLANLTTGIINICIQTIQASVTISMFILIVYMVFISFVTLALEIKKYHLQ